MNTSTGRLNYQANAIGVWKNGTSSVCGRIGVDAAHIPDMRNGGRKHVCAVMVESAPAHSKGDGKGEGSKGGKGEVARVQRMFEPFHRGTKQFI